MLLRIEVRGVAAGGEDAETACYQVDAPTRRVPGGAIYEHARRRDREVDGAVQHPLQTRHGETCEQGPGDENDDDYVPGQKPKHEARHDERDRDLVGYQRFRPLMEQRYGRVPQALCSS